MLVIWWHYFSMLDFFWKHSFWSNALFQFTQFVHDCLTQTVFTIASDAKNASFSYFHSFASHIHLFLNKLLEIKCGFTKNKHWSRSSCRLAHLCLFNHIHFISFGNVKLWVGAALKLFCSHWSPTARIITS